MHREREEEVACQKAGCEDGGVVRGRLDWKEIIYVSRRRRPAGGGPTV